ncbi:hypothetical protein IFHNHDMJ_02880 [Synechococcus sp. CBW1107]|nr:hypothetical protein IFHNHDMJ_02880 [Synechococcus sp. CBW1107]
MLSGAQIAQRNRRARRGSLPAGHWRSRHPACTTTCTVQGLNASRCATLARRWRRRGVTAVSFASTAMAATLLSLPLQPVRPAAVRHCPIRIISVHLLDAAGQLLRVLFLDREGHITAEPHFVPRAEALILAANQQRVLGAQARVQVR